MQPVPPQIPGYEIHAMIGESALTEVWAAYQPTLQRRVNLKVLKPGAAACADETHRFVREAQHAAALRHPVILAIYNVMEQNGRHIVVMEHAAGPTLYQVLGERGHLPWARAAEIAAHVADALAYAWNSAKLIHRCINPGSIRLEGDGGIKLAYIGLSVRVDPLNPTRRAVEGYIEGIPYYMAPEQARGAGDLDFRADMYGLGCTLYHMLTGKMPFGDRDPLTAIRCQIEERLPNPTAFCPALPASLLHVLCKLMRRHPADRYRSWNDALTELRKASAGHMLISKQRRVVDCAIDIGVLAAPRRAGRLVVCKR